MINSPSDLACMLSLATTHPATPGTFNQLSETVSGSWTPGLSNPCSLRQSSMVSHVPSLLPPVSSGTAWPQFANQRKQIKFNPALTQMVFMGVLFACCVPPILLQHYSNLLMVVS